MFDNDDSLPAILVGIVLGVAFTVFPWVCVAKEVEMCKVKAGYLTFQNKTYKVSLYDTLDVPEKDGDE